MTRALGKSESIQARVRLTATELLRRSSTGLRYSALLRALGDELPDVKGSSLPSALVAFAQKLPDEISKPSQGFYVHRRFADEVDGKATDAPAPKGRTREAVFYEPLADWLVNELEECTRATVVGGSKFGSKWGTPDVIGIKQHRPGALIPFPTEVVSAELKTDGSQLIVAFGQAVSYRLFSHKSYLFVPVDSPEPDVARLDVLARIVGIGLVLFDATAPANPMFSIRVRAAKHEPDGFYLNERLRHVQDELFP